MHPPASLFGLQLHFVQQQPFQVPFQGSPVSFWIALQQYLVPALKMAFNHFNHLAALQKQRIAPRACYCMLSVRPSPPVRPSVVRAPPSCLCYYIGLLRRLRRLCASSSSSHQQYCSLQLASKKHSFSSSLKTKSHCRNGLLHLVEGCTALSGVRSALLLHTATATVQPN